MNDDPIVIEIPAELKSLAKSLRKFIKAVERRKNLARSGSAIDYAEIESTFSELTGDLQRQAHGVTLRALDSGAERIRVRGRVFKSIGPSSRRFMTLAGPIAVSRTLYREVGVRNGKTVDPLALRAGMIEEVWLPETAKAMALLVQQAPSRESEGTAQGLHVLPYSRSSFERVAHALGELYVREHVDVEDEMIECFVIPEGATSISVSLDRVSVPMEEPRPKPKGRPRKGAAKRPIERVYRMAYCGTVTLHDAKGKALHTIRYGRMPASDPMPLCQGLASDVATLLERKSSLKVTLLADGAPEMWNLLDAHVNRASLGVPVQRNIDFWHVIEKLAAAAKVIYPASEERSRTIARWKSILRQRSCAAVEILSELVASGLEYHYRGDHQPVHQAITYLVNNGDRMDYRKARRQGLPIGSGNVEATCKTLVEVRMKRAGARWKDVSGEHVLQLRALAQSDRWETGMALALARVRTPIRKVA